MRTLPAIVVPGLLLAALAGCGDEPAAPEAASPGTGLVGLTFVSTAVTVDDEPRPLAEGTRLRIEFADDQVSVDAGCNHLSGSASFGDGVLRVGGLGGTEMGCDPARMDQDAWLAGFLADDPRYVLDGDSLTLTRAGTAITLEPEPAEPAADLVGTRWRLDGIVAGSGPDATVGSAPAGVRSTLRLFSDHAFGLRTGCNTAGGRVEIGDATIRFSHVVSTLMLCRNASGAVEESVLDTLRGEVAYVIDGHTLTLTRDDRGLVYRAT